MVERLRNLKSWQMGILLATLSILFLAANTYPYWYWRLTGRSLAPITQMTDAQWSPKADAAYIMDTDTEPGWRLTLTVAMSLGAVIMIAYGGTWALREILGPPTGGRQRRGLVSVREVSALSPKQVLYVVRAGGKFLLLGATEEQISYLTELDMGEGTASFAEQLESAETPGPSLGAVLAGVRAKIAALRPERTPQVEVVERLV
jgi:flagellar biogenesis protein FliO